MSPTRRNTGRTFKHESQILSKSLYDFSLHSYEADVFDLYKSKITEWIRFGEVLQVGLCSSRM